jgi:MFS family permease
LDYPLGKLSDKIGEKKILIFGFLISAFFTTLIPFITEPKIWLWALVLFMTRIGAACIEVMSESYFFKNVEEEDDDEISFFRNTTPLSFVIAPLAALLVLSFVPSFKFIVPVLGAVLLSGALISLRLKDVR